MKIINFKKINGLLPAVIQDEKSSEALMLGYMNKDAYEKTIKKGFVYFWSRSRKRLWMKGEQSGNKLRVKKLFIDCDGDCLLILVEVLGKGACHTGNYSCFFNKII